MREESLNAPIVETLEPRTLLSVDPVLVADLAIGAGGSNPSQFVNVSGTLFFRANDGVNGDELWRSDGTSAGTTLVKDIVTGSGSSNPSYLTNVNGTLFFRANDGVNGDELWRSDGTSAGTTLVRDIVTGSGSSNPLFLTNVNGTMFFSANDGVNGDELWQSDGTSAGTTLVKDIVTGSGGSNSSHFVNVSGKLFFSANDGVNGSELWQSDGTSAGTTLVKDIRSGSSGSYLSYLTNVNGTLYFRAFDDTNGFELWQSDGMSAGTALVKDIRSGSSGSSPGSLTNVNGKLFFRANDGVTGDELWQSDGTSAGTTLVKDLVTGSSSSYPNYLTNLNGTLFFSANDGVNGYELWRSDDMSAGTTLVKDIRSGSIGSSPGSLTDVDGTLFFSADNGTNGRELWSIPSNAIPVNSRPQLTAFAAAVETTPEDTEVELTFSELVAQGDESDADGTVDAFIVKAVTSGTLKIGTSAASAIAFAVGSNDRIDATKKAYWTPAANNRGNDIAAFSVLAQDNMGDNSLVPVTATVNVNAVADTPSVTNAATLANTQTTSGLVISRNAADGAEVTHFKITSITGGTLFQNNGTTAISNGAFITEANAGLRFTPAQNSLVTGHFSVQASTGNSDSGRGGSLVVANITITPAPIGTAGSDAFVLTYSGAAPTGSVSVTISTNGGAATAFGTFAMNAPITINGLGGTDSVRIVGTAGADTIIVNSSTGLVVNGASLILTNIENRTLVGGAGGDVYRFDADTALGLWTLDEAGGGIDTVDFTPTTTVGLVLNLATSGTQPVHATNLSLILGSAATIENVTGGSGADTLFGNGLDNTLTGGAGDDRLIGAGGSDLLLGGANNDRYDFFPTTVLEADQVTENANEGIDTVNFAFLTTDVVVNLASTSIQPVHTNRTLKLNSATVLENIVGGSGADRLFGNSLDNSITGNAGNDQLIGAGGNDLMLGGADNDTYVFVPTTVAEADTVSENLNQGTDTLSFAFLTTNVIVNLGSTSVQTVHTNRTLKLNSAVVFENTLGGSGADTLFGNTLANTLTGNAGDDKLLGSSGNDTLLGGANNDIYMFVPSNAAEADTVTENADEGIDTLNFAYLTTSVVLNLGSTSIQPVNLNRTLRLNSVSTFENAVGGTGSDTLLGNAVANRLTGGLGDNILVGLEGGDILEAGNGRDILIGGLGLDILKGDAGDDILIAGRTTNDTNLIGLNAFRTQWISGNAYAARVTNLRTGVGSPLVSLKATINVLNDAGEDDVLFGGADTDWFLRAVDDVITDLFAGELIDVL
jgi:ELWxxDGT repeat protein